MDVLEEDIAVASFMFIMLGSAYNFYISSNQKKRRKRRWGVRPIFQRRRELGHYHNLFLQMKGADREQFFKYTRMSPTCFHKLLNLIQHKLEKHSKREALSPEHRLAITLYYLAHGCSMQVVAWSFLIGKSTVSFVIRETCQAIWDVLSPIYLKAPTVNEYQHISKRFEERWNLPNCCGALDGKHITIQAPKKSGSAFFNYKKTFSLVLMAVCDADYKFTLVDVGAFGSQSDGGVFAESKYGQGLENGTIKLPPNSPLPGTIQPFPMFFVGDEAFPLKSYIMRPYPGKRLEARKRIFNYRMSRARRTIENSFGILSSRWRIFRNSIIANESTVEKITAAAICLHNFLKSIEIQLPTSEQMYCPANFADMENADGSVTLGKWRELTSNSFQRMGRMGSNYANRSMIELRDELANYLEEKGAVSWQLAYITRGSTAQFIHG